MQTSFFDTAIRQLAIASISGYQKHISPKKGFACAHRVLYGGESCSQYIKGSIGKYGLFEAVKKSRHRFAACKQASQILKTRFSSQSEGKNSSDKPRSESDRHCRSSQCQNNCADAISELSCNLSIESLDCSGADCCELDCSGADCGSCF